ncbi:MAG: hypothetical protein JO013_02145 [Alphaproteobacteria bacterium]|nr:hypothetical protein [Alphaproteobacteria bacterium]
MPVTLRGVNRTLPLLAGLAASACVHADTGRRGGAVTTFVNSHGDSISIGRDAITVDGSTYRLVDCSDREQACLRADDIGFHASFPRACPDFVWTPAAAPMILTATWPHGGAGFYANRGRGGFAYQWQNREGLTALVPASSGSVDARAPVNPAHADLYVRRSGPRLLACR